MFWRSFCCVEKQKEYQKITTTLVCRRRSFHAFAHENGRRNDGRLGVDCVDAVAENFPIVEATFVLCAIAVRLLCGHTAAVRRQSCWTSISANSAATAACAAAARLSARLQAAAALATAAIRLAHPRRLQTAATVARNNRQPANIQKRARYTSTRRLLSGQRLVDNHFFVCFLFVIYWRVFHASFFFFFLRATNFDELMRRRPASAHARAFTRR